MWLYELRETLYPDLQILKQSFSSPQTQTYEIILTLGQAFEVAYQMAIQSRARQYVPPSSLGSEVIETKTSRPVSQSWSSMRRSAVSTTLHTKKEVCRCERVELAVEGEQKHGVVQSWYRKGTETSWPTFSLLLNAQWATYRGRFAVCVVESDESLLCYQFHLTQTPTVWVPAIKRHFLVVHMGNMMNE